MVRSIGVPLSVVCLAAFALGCSETGPAEQGETTGADTETAGPLELLNSKDLEVVLLNPEHEELNEVALANAHELAESMSGIFELPQGEELEQERGRYRVEIEFIRFGAALADRQVEEPVLELGTGAAPPSEDPSVDIGDIRDREPNRPSIPSRRPDSGPSNGVAEIGRITDFGVIHPGTRAVFRVRIPPQLIRFAGRIGESLSLHHGSQWDGDYDPDTVFEPPLGNANEPGGAQTIGISYGDDTRVVWGDSGVSHTVNPWRKLTHNSNGCTGAIVGPRHMLTAAHCLTPEAGGGESFYQFTAYPGRQGMDYNTWGETTVSPTWEPGDPTIWYYVPWYYMKPGSVSSRQQFDFGYVVLPDRVGERVENGTMLGWFGWWYATKDLQGGIDKFNRGYPGCDIVDYDMEPSPCIYHTLYGDQEYCDYSNYREKGPDGWNRLVSADCDASRGHSGAPVYFKGNGSIGPDNVRLITGIAVASRCLSLADCDDERWSTEVVRLTPEMSDIMLMFREMYQ